MEPTKNPPLPMASEAAPAFDEVAVNDWSTLNWGREVRLNRLSASDRILVTTRNHSYEIVVNDPDTGEVHVRGGNVFPLFTAARLIGSCLGGSLVKLRSINPGFQIEFAINGRGRIVTSQVRDVSVTSKI